MASNIRDFVSSRKKFDFPKKPLPEHRKIKAKKMGAKKVPLKVEVGSKIHYTAVKRINLLYPGLRVKKFM